MELYESLFIIRPSVSDEETNALIEKMKSVADKTGAQFIKSENWGRKKLAYEVRRERKGTYVYFYFKAPNNTVGELEHAYRLEDNIIKFLTVHLEKELVPRRTVEAPSEEFTGGRIYQSHSRRQSHAQSGIAIHAQRNARGYSGVGGQSPL